MPEVVEAKPVTVRNVDHLFRCRPEMILHQHVRDTRLHALEPVGTEDEILVSRVSPSLSPVLQQAHDKRMQHYRLLRGGRLWFAKLAPHEIGDNADAKLVPIDVLPSQREYFDWDKFRICVVSNF